jgi:hypothetical protein
LYSCSYVILITNIPIQSSFSFINTKTTNQFSDTNQFDCFFEIIPRSTLPFSNSLPLSASKCFSSSQQFSNSLTFSSSNDILLSQSYSDSLSFSISKNILPLQSLPLPSSTFSYINQFSSLVFGASFSENYISNTTLISPFISSNSFSVSIFNSESEINFSSSISLKLNNKVKYKYQPCLWWILVLVNSILLFISVIGIFIICYLFSWELLKSNKNESSNIDGIGDIDDINNIDQESTQDSPELQTAVQRSTINVSIPF